MIIIFPGKDKVTYPPRNEDIIKLELLRQLSVGTNRWIDEQDKIAQNLLDDRGVTADHRAWTGHSIHRADTTSQFGNWCNRISTSTHGQNWTLCELQN